jgi:alkylhydroperoxidase family enzyme
MADGRLEEVFVALGRVEAAAWRAGDPALLRATAARCGELLELAPCTPPADLPEGDTGAVASAEGRAALAFAAQFCLDVATLDDLRRVEMTEALGHGAFDYVQAVYVFDYVPRVRTVLAELTGAPVVASVPPASDGTASGSLWAALEDLLRVIGRLRQLDAVTSELVRLRGAGQHDCRLCQSLRSRSAILAGADDDLFALVDHPGSDRLSPRHRAALDLTDAIIWHPARLDPDLVRAVERELTPPESTELVLDVMRNAANKIAVALQADTPHVTEGVEIYDIDELGEAVYGLSLP